MAQSKESGSLQPDSSSADNTLRLLEVFLNHLGQRAQQAESRADFYNWLIPNLAALLQTHAILILGNETPHGWKVLGRQESHGLSEDDERRLTAQIAVQPKSAATWSSLRFGERTAFLSKHLVNEGLTICLAILPKRIASGSDSQLLQDLCVEIGSAVVTFERARHQALLDQKLARSDAFIATVQNLVTTLSSKQLARFLVNDLASLLQFDRVSWFQDSGKPLAVSGVVNIGRRSKFGDVWSDLVRHAARTGQQSDHTHADQPHSPAAKSVWERILAATEVHEALLVPLVGSGPNKLGVLVCESFQSESKRWPEKRQYAEQVIARLLPFLEHSLRLQRIPYLGLRIWAGETLWSRPTRTAAWLILLAALVTVGIWQLFGVTRAFEIPVKAELEPITRKTVFAATAGKVESYLVANEASVEVGALLVKMSSIELEQEITTNRGLLAEALSSLATSQVALSKATNTTEDRVRLSSEIEQTKARIEGFREIEKLLIERKSNLEVVSPIAGQAIVRGFEQQLMNRPIPAGEALLEVAETAGPWRLRAAIEERHIGYLLQQQAVSNTPLTVRFRLVTHPTKIFTGQLETVELYSRTEQGAETAGTGQVTAHVLVDRDELGDYLRVGTGAWARIDCGERSNWFLLTYELRDKIREWFFY